MAIITEPTPERDNARRVEYHEHHREMKKTAGALAGASGLEIILAAAAVVLAVLGLVDILPGYMAAIATLCMGAGLLARGGGVAAALRRLARETGLDRREQAAFVGGSSAEVAAGLAGIALGILALIGIVPLLPGPPT